METVPHMHDFFTDLPEGIRAEVKATCSERSFRKGEAVYCQGDMPHSAFQIQSGGVRLCNYTMDGGEVITGELRPGDCFGEMGLIDGLSRVSHAIANSDCLLRVMSKADFDDFNRKYPEFSHQVMLTLTRRVRYLFGLNAESAGLSLHQRLALNLYRLAFSKGVKDDAGELYIKISQDELGRMLGASRQTINKELQSLVDEGSVALRYGKIYLTDLDSLQETYSHIMGSGLIMPSYPDSA